MNDDRHWKDIDTRVRIAEKDIERVFDQNTNIKQTENRIFSSLIGGIVIFFSTFIGFQIYNTVEIREAIRSNEQAVSSFLREAESQISETLGEILDARVEVSGISERPENLTAAGLMLSRDQTSGQLLLILETGFALQHDASGPDDLLGLQYQLGEDFLQLIGASMSTEEFSLVMLSNSFVAYDSADSFSVPPNVLVTSRLTEGFRLLDCEAGVDLLESFDVGQLVGTIFVRPVFSKITSIDDLKALGLELRFRRNLACN